MAKKPNPEWPTDDPHWTDFVAFSILNGISLSHTDDWTEWWKCFLAGVESCRVTHKDIE